MAIAKRAPAVRKKKVERATPRIKRGTKIQGPSFDGWETWTGEQFHVRRRAARDFFYENFKITDLLPEVWAWMKDNKYTVSEIRAARSYGVGMTTAIGCKMLRIGMPDLSPKHADYYNNLVGTMGDLLPTTDFIKRDIARAIERGRGVVIEEKKAEKAKASVRIVTIQDRIRDHANDIIGDIEEVVDEYISAPTKFNPAEINAAMMLRSAGAKSAHAKIVKAYYQRLLNEYNEFLGKNCDKELAEGYNSTTKRNITKIRDFLVKLIESCDQVAGEAKVMRKPRTKKVKPAADLVKNIKFKITDDRYNLSSITPAQIIGASSLVVFNTKTRKIGLYQSQTDAGFGVKGASITNFNEKSQQKTLRKPEIQIKEFREVNTAKRMQVWFNGIKTTSTALTGRINGEVMILRVWK